MLGLNLVAVLVATVVFFVIGAAYYARLGDRLAPSATAQTEPIADRPAAATVAVELFRGLVVVIAVAVLVTGLNLTSVSSGLLLALGLWAGFPVVLLAGSVFHERVPLGRAALHAGDWLLKLAVITPILTVWR